jgi:hypothetical protein
MLKSPIFKKNGAHLVGKKTFKKIMDYVFLRFKSFEHAKTFFICVKLWTWKIGIFFYKNPNYYVSLVIIQTCKNVVLKKCPLT